MSIESPSFELTRTDVLTDDEAREFHGVWVKKLGTAYREGDLKAANEAARHLLELELVHPWLAPKDDSHVTSHDW